MNSAVQALQQDGLFDALDYRHPQATHQVLLQQRVRVAYALVRCTRRSIGFVVDAQGLAVRAPRWVGLAQIEAALHDKARWICAKLAEQQQRHQGQQEQRLQWQDGAVLPYLGGALRLQLQALAPRGGLLLAVGEGAWVLHLPLAPDSPAASIRAAVQAWWLRQARQCFTERLQRHAPALRVQWRSLRLSNARTRWGSAKSDGSIMLNWRLLHYPLAVLDYVVVHELSHLRVMDHSPRFWATVAEVVPDHAALRRQLRDTPAPVWA